MNVSILGYKLKLEMLILLGVIILLLVGHTFGGCCNYSLLEGLTTDMSGNHPIVQKLDASGNPVLSKLKATGATLRQDISGNLDASGAAVPEGFSIGGSKGSTIEGFVGANTNYGQSSPFDLTGESHINTASWSQPDLTVVPGQPLNPAVKQFMDREPQPVPLPKGEMFMFASTPFKPECCPNTYSTSQGCACMTGQQYNFLAQRGSNNVPYSEY